jgi:hypothetical protein
MTRVVYHLREDGTWQMLADGPVTILVIDERVPRDRVYQMSEKVICSHEAIDRLIGDSRIGKLGDMPGAEAAVRAFLDGEPPPETKLTIVPKDDDT